MELEIDKKEFERIQQELIQATAENITLEYFEYEGKKWINEDFVIPISVIQNKKRELEKKKEYLKDEYDEGVVEIMCRYRCAIKTLDELLEERNKNDM